MKPGRVTILVRWPGCLPGGSVQKEAGYVDLGQEEEGVCWRQKLESSLLYCEVSYDYYDVQ